MTTINQLHHLHRHLLPSSLFPFLLLLLLLPNIVLSLVCYHCGGRDYSGDLMLSRESCCHVTKMHCRPGQVCIRAFVASPQSNFFLSGCHEPEDEFEGCDSHSLPMNATVYRCICSTSKCQSQFPGECPSKSAPSHHRHHSSQLFTKKAKPTTTTTTTEVPTTTTTLTSVTIPALLSSSHPYNLLFLLVQITVLTLS